MADQPPSVENVSANDLLKYVDSLSQGMLGESLLNAMAAIEDAIAGKAKQIAKVDLNFAALFVDERSVKESKDRITAGVKIIAETISNYQTLLVGALSKAVLAYNRSGNINELLFGVKGAANVQPIQVNVAAPTTNATPPAPAVRGEREDITFGRSRSVTVVEFADKALKQLKSLIGGVRSGDSTTDDGKKKGKGDENASWFPKMNWLAALAGIGVLLDGLFSSDKWRNVKKVIGDFILRGRHIFGAITDLFKNVIELAKGGIKNLYTTLKASALKLVTKLGKMVGGLFGDIAKVIMHPIDTIKSIFGTLKTVFMAPIAGLKGLWGMIKGVGKALMHPIDTIKSLFTSVTSMFKGGGILAKLNPKSILAGLKMGFKALISGGAKVALTKIPILGAVIGVGFGIKRWMDGDMTGGIIEIFGGLANLFPGVGTVLSLAVDALLIWRDSKMGGIEGLKAGNKDPLKQLWEDVKERLWNTGFMKGMRSIGGGLYELSQGNFLEGFKMIAVGLKDATPIGWVMSLFEDKFDPETGTVTSPAKKFMKSDFVKAINQTVYGWLPSYLQSAFEITPDGSVAIKSPEEVAKSLLPDWYIGKDGAYDKIKGSTSWAKDKVAGFTDKIQSGWNSMFDSANDLIVPSGGKPIKLHPEDSIVAAKPNGPIDKLLAPAKNQDQSIAHSVNFEKGLKTLTDEVIRLGKVIEKAVYNQTKELSEIDALGVKVVAGQLQALAQATMKASTAAPQQASSQVTQSTDMRDPAYIARQRAHGVLSPSRRIIGG